jgi:hypothetical protein
VITEQQVPSYSPDDSQLGRNMLCFIMRIDEGAEVRIFNVSTKLHKDGDNWIHEVKNVQLWSDPRNHIIQK